MLNKEEKVLLLAFIVLVGFVAAVFFHYFSGGYLHQSYPKNTFLYAHFDVWNDFFSVFEQVKAGSGRYTVYFPFAYLPFFLLSPLPMIPAAVVFLLIFIIGFTWYVYSQIDFLPRMIRLIVTFILSFLTYPFLFCFDRGNLECFVFLLLVLFFINFRKENYKASVLCLAAAAAMKLYPGIFIILFLARRRFREVAAVGVLTLALTFASAALYPGGIAGTFQNITSNIGGFKEMFILGERGIRFNSSYFGVLKLTVSLYNSSIISYYDDEQSSLLINRNVDELIMPYRIFCLALFFIISLYIYWRERVFWKQVALLTFAMILFPEVSFDYKLLHLFLPLMFFLRADERDENDRIYTVIFALLFIPKAYYWFAADINIGVLVNPLLITILGLAIIYSKARAITPAHSRDNAD